MPHPTIATPAAIATFLPISIISSCFSFLANSVSEELFVSPVLRELSLLPIVDPLGPKCHHHQNIDNQSHSSKNAGPGSNGWSFDHQHHHTSDNADPERKASHVH
ncbi:hypothetical protein Leryth_009972 [Lithospermum erythrorhizon]|nr:hypothetical protein Leryth_009972 [Lithospermum erythrorhizon]